MNKRFNMYGETPADVIDRKNKRIKELEKALKLIASYGTDGICPYGCDTPSIAQKALDAIERRR